MNFDYEKEKLKATLQLSGLFGERFNIPKPAKYKKVWEKEPDNLPDLEFGKTAVVQRTVRMQVQGYLLCKVIDWEVDEGYWSVRTRIILLVLESSHEKLDGLIGRLITAEHKSQGWSSEGNLIVSFDKSYMPKRKE